jgi:hypothetical protein
MIIEDDLSRACQAVGFLATEIERRIRAGECRETATRHAWHSWRSTHQQRPPLRVVEDCTKDNGV